MSDETFPRDITLHHILPSMTKDRVKRYSRRPDKKKYKTYLISSSPLKADSESEIIEVSQEDVVVTPVKRPSFLQNASPLHRVLPPLSATPSPSPPSKLKPVVKPRPSFSGNPEDKPSPMKVDAVPSEEAKPMAVEEVKIEPITTATIPEPMQEEVKIPPPVVKREKSTPKKKEPESQAEPQAELESKSRSKSQPQQPKQQQQEAAAESQPEPESKSRSKSQPQQPKQPKPEPIPEPQKQPEFIPEPQPQKQQPEPQKQPEPQRQPEPEAEVDMEVDRDEGDRAPILQKEERKPMGSQPIEEVSWIRSWINWLLSFFGL